MQLSQREHDNIWVNKYIDEKMREFEKFIKRKVELGKLLKLPIEEDNPEAFVQRKYEIEEYKHILDGYTYYKIMEQFLKKFWYKQQPRLDLDYFLLYK